MTTDCTSIQRALAIHRPERPLPAAVAEHLGGCSDCRRLRDLDDGVWRALDGYAVPAPSTGLVDAIAARVAGDQLAARRHRPAWSWARFAAAAALVMAAGAGLGGWLGLGTRADRVSATPASTTLVDHAELFGAAPPGSLASAYASLERGEVAP